MREKRGFEGFSSARVRRKTKISGGFPLKGGEKRSRRNFFHQSEPEVKVQGGAEGNEGAGSFSLAK